MPIIRLTREQVLAAPFDQEEFALLSELARLDLRDGYQIDKYVRPLLTARLQQIRDERVRLGLPPFDAGRAMDAENDLRAEAEMDDKI